MHRTTFEKQQERIVANANGNQPEVQLIRACTPGEGIVILSDQDKMELEELFAKDESKKTFFVPSSGSGSRMFQFLFDFISEPNETNRSHVERFLNHIEDFAFFNQFPPEIQVELRNRSMSIDQFVAYILNNKGMGLAHLPKGLIPFHKYGPFILNPFQEHVLQGRKVCNGQMNFHFTVTERFEKEIEKHLDFMYGMTGHKSEITFSSQNAETDAFAFNPDGTPALCENEEQLRRPAGHGALLENMSELDADLIFVKNIDNVQHFNHSEKSIDTHRILAGCLIKIQSEIKALLENWSDDEFELLNTKYQIFDIEYASKLSKAEKIQLLNRPTRVCGMVRNEGQPGGGPFWINDNGVATKQIVEKAQISMSTDQYRVMIQSTHFNPVLMVCQGKHFDGSAIDFESYRDNDKYFIVNKKYQGKDIRFIELPGLWNGGMAYWNSIFVEVPSEAFSPVKTILDLLESAHQH